MRGRLTKRFRQRVFAYHLHANNERRPSIDNRLQALNVNFTLLWSADPKPAAIQFAADNLVGIGGHHFHDIADATERSGFCEHHGKTCTLPENEVCDLFIAGFPCTPFSTMRRVGPRYHDQGKKPQTQCGLRRGPPAYLKWTIGFSSIRRIVHIAFCQGESTGFLFFVRAVHTCIGVRNLRTEHGCL